MESGEFPARFLQAGETPETLEAADDEKAANVVLLDALADDGLNGFFGREVTSEWKQKISEYIQR